MDPFFSLILLCIAMLLASFLAGNVPLSFHLSEDRLKLISNFGVGLLVGTALVVIIPEGVETLYSVPPPNSVPQPPINNNNNGKGIIDHNRPISKRGYYSPVIPKIALAAETLLKKRDVVVTTQSDHPYLIQEQFKRGIVANEEGSSFESNMFLTRKDDDKGVVAGMVLQHDIKQSSGEIDQLMELSMLALAPLAKRQLDDVDDEGRPDIHAGGGDNVNEQDDGHGTGTNGAVADDGDDDKNKGGNHMNDEEEEEENDAHKYIGLALLSGFILMFLIDQMGPTHAHGHNNNHVSVADFTELHNLQLDDSNIRMPSAAGGGGLGSAKKRGNPITIGLVVHAAADGIALGASASRPELRFIVFLAIMLHKAPAAFGLSTVLLQHGFSRRQTRQQVAIFSLAAPIGAILTYIFIQMSGQSDSSSLHWWTGMLLLFSGGTFLYVAMHVMSEMNNNNADRSNSGYNVGGAEAGKGLALGEVLCVIGGMIVPLLLSVDHEH
ncbi:hypothetical protein BG004_002010 [Podila humilis]|nr:hypothetical protein BG004_002010 [Podila humilis]